MPKELQITTVLNGWIVRAGCQILVFSDPVVMAEEFRDWLKEPARVEEKYKRLMRAKGIGPTDPPEPQSMPQNSGQYSAPRDETVGKASNELAPPPMGRPIGPASQA